MPTASSSSLDLAVLAITMTCPTTLATPSVLCSASVSLCRPPLPFGLPMIGATPTLLLPPTLAGERDTVVIPTASAFAAADVRMSFSKYRSEAVVAVNSKATGARIRFAQAHQAASALLALHRRPGAFLRVDCPPVSVFPLRLMWRASCLLAARCPPSFPSLSHSTLCASCRPGASPDRPVPRDSLVVRLLLVVPQLREGLVWLPAMSVALRDLWSSLCRK